jgi:P-type Ca2+ transporter type 2C
MLAIMVGLTSAEAARRLERDGANLLPTQPRVPLWRRIAAQMRDPLILVLMAAAALTSLIGDWADASIIALVVLVNTTSDQLVVPPPGVMPDDR